MSISALIEKKVVPSKEATMSDDDVFTTVQHDEAMNDGTNTPPAMMPSTAPAKRGRAQIDETRGVKLAPPRVHSLNYTVV